MLKKLLRIKRPAPHANHPAASPIDEMLFERIAELSKTDPLIGAKLGSKDITQRLITAMKSERGVHIESLLCALGSLAGYACQASVRAKAVALGLAETSHLTVVDTKDGKRYFFGEHLNQPLAESPYSVLALVAGAAQQAGSTKSPDVGGIFKHVADTVGTGVFGRPRVPEQHRPHDLPVNYVHNLWPGLLPIIRNFCPNPEHWPILLGLSIQEVIDLGKQTLDPYLSVRLVMESAIPMSKIDFVA